MLPLRLACHVAIIGAFSEPADQMQSGGGPLNGEHLSKRALGAILQKISPFRIQRTHATDMVGETSLPHIGRDRCLFKRRQEAIRCAQGSDKGIDQRWGNDQISEA